jgi:hypothetical protein
MAVSLEENNCFFVIDQTPCPNQMVYIFAYQKSQIRYILEGLGKANYGIFYGHVVYFVALWYIFPL